MQIRVKITRDGSNKINVMDMEAYLRGVVPSEIPASSGKAALMAQAVAARTYAAHKVVTRSKYAFDVDDTTSYQAYRPTNTDSRTDAAVIETRGVVLMYDGKIVDAAVYSASNGGNTTSAKERWGSERPYLPSQEDPYDKKAGYKRDGHGVGMSQRGAQQMAKEGMTYEAILGFYYPGTDLINQDVVFTPVEPKNCPTLRRGDRGDSVLDLQAILIAKGYDLGASGGNQDGADGIFGIKTDVAVRLFQKDRRLVIDGIIGTKSWTALLS